MPTTVLVTGAAGFIGSTLCDALVREGRRVIGYDNFDPYYAPERKRRNLSALCANPLFSLEVGNILDERHLFDVISGSQPDVVVHLAARAGVRPSLEQPSLYQRVNVCGTTNVLEAARRCGVTTAVLASSSSVYGANTKTPFSESDEVLQPISPYAASKRAMELIAYTYSHLYGMDISCLRFFTAYGPRQRPDMAIHKFVDRVMREEPIEMFGDGSTRRDYTYIDDIVCGVKAAIDRATGQGFQIFNLGNSETVALNDLIDCIGRAAGKQPRIDARPSQPGDVDITYADISKARDLLGYSPTTSIEQGIERFVSWYADDKALGPLQAA